MTLISYATLPVHQRTSVRQALAGLDRLTRTFLVFLPDPLCHGLSIATEYLCPFVAVNLPAFLALQLLLLRYPHLTSTCMSSFWPAIHAAIARAQATVPLLDPDHIVLLDAHPFRPESLILPKVIAAA
jgi:hypothetical protein